MPRVIGFARESDFDTLVSAAAARYGIDPALVYATIAIESGFDPSAYRAEPAIGDASWGLMQLLYRTARGLGYVGPAEGLLDPATSIEYGTALLAQLRARYAGQHEGAIYAAYNAGVARTDSEGYYINSKGNRAVHTRVLIWLDYLHRYRTAAAATAPVSSDEPADVLEPPSEEQKDGAVDFDGMLASLPWINTSVWWGVTPAADQPSMSQMVWVAAAAVGVLLMLLSRTR